MEENFVKRGFLFQFSTDTFFLGSDVSILTAAKTPQTEGSCTYWGGALGGPWLNGPGLKGPMGAGPGGPPGPGPGPTGQRGP